MKKLLAFVVLFVLTISPLFADNSATIKFSGEGVTEHTITYVNDEGEEVTEKVVADKEYPAASVVVFADSGSIIVTLGTFTTTVLGDTGAQFSTLGSDPVSGIVVASVGTSNLTANEGGGSYLVTPEASEDGEGGEGGGGETTGIVNPAQINPTQPTVSDPVVTVPVTVSEPASDPVDTY